MASLPASFSNSASRNAQCGECDGCGTDGVLAGRAQWNSSRCSLIPGVEHRIEFVRGFDGVEYFNDSKATNVDAH